jgi:hypothetical protein
MNPCVQYWPKSKFTWIAQWNHDLLRSIGISSPSVVPDQSDSAHFYSDKLSFFTLIFIIQLFNDRSLSAVKMVNDFKSLVGGIGMLYSRMAAIKLQLPLTVKLQPPLTVANRLNSNVFNDRRSCIRLPNVLGFEMRIIE